MLRGTRQGWISHCMRSERDLRNLLAVIHRDGGQHTDLVGVVQSTLDAHQVWAKLIIKAEINKPQIELEVLSCGKIND